MCVCGFVIICDQLWLLFVCLSWFQALKTVEVCVCGSVLERQWCIACLFKSQQQRKPKAATKQEEGVKREHVTRASWFSSLMASCCFSTSCVSQDKKWLTCVSMKSLAPTHTAYLSTSMTKHTHAATAMCPVFRVGLGPHSITKCFSDIKRSKNTSVLEINLRYKKMADMSMFPSRLRLKCFLCLFSIFESSQLRFTLR